MVRPPTSRQTPGCGASLRQRRTSPWAPSRSPPPPRHRSQAGRPAAPSRCGPEPVLAAGSPQAFHRCRACSERRPTAAEAPSPAQRREQRPGCLTPRAWVQGCSGKCTLEPRSLLSRVTLTWPCHEDSRPLRILASQTSLCWAKPRIKLRNLICKLMLSSRRRFRPSCNNISGLSASQPQATLFCSLFPNPVVLEVWPPAGSLGLPRGL